MKHKHQQEVVLKGESNNFIVISLLTLLQFCGSYLFPHYLYSINLFVVLACGLYLYFAKTQNWDLRFIILFFLFSATLGTSGSGVIFVSLLLYYLYRYLTQTLGDLLISLNPDISKDKSEIVYERILYHLDNFNPNRVPIPFTDLMAFGSYTQKRMAIEKMLRYYRPEFANPLKMGLDDPSSSVKVQAATAINFIDHKKFDENIELAKASEKYPSDLDLLKEYADDTYDYIKSEILDEDRKQKLIHNAIQSYRRYLKKDPYDEEVNLKLAELLFLAKDYKSTKEHLETLLNKKFSRPEALLMMEVFYATKEYKALQEFALECQKKQTREIDDELGAKIKLWASG